MGKIKNLHRYIGMHVKKYFSGFVVFFNGISGCRIAIIYTYPYKRRKNQLDPTIKTFCVRQIFVLRNYMAISKNLSMENSS